MFPSFTPTHFLFKCDFLFSISRHFKNTETYGEYLYFCYLELININNFNFHLKTKFSIFKKLACQTKLSTWPYLESFFSFSQPFGSVSNESGLYPLSSSHLPLYLRKNVELLYYLHDILYICCLLFLLFIYADI